MDLDISSKRNGNRAEPTVNTHWRKMRQNKATNGLGDRRQMTGGKTVIR